ncbi:DUF1491 family protein [Allosphingosinicella sp.]|uniref:DUF1491 family protein n=1 Tax=Allosphingosinicella sp. TaxID=2823234 RepID=UPI0037831836
MSARLATQVLVSSLIRRAQAEGGFGAVLAKGDATAGAVMVVVAQRGVRTLLLERLLLPEGSYAWQDNGRAGVDDSEFGELLARRRRGDPDLWLIELDVADAAAFVAGMNEVG